MKTRRSHFQAAVDSSLSLPKTPWSDSVDSVVESLASSADGITSAEGEKRLLQFGSNRIAATPPVSLWVLFFGQFRSLIVVLLVTAAIVSAAIGDVVEAIAVLAVVVINALIGFATEWKATRSMDALKKLSRTMVRVRRGTVRVIAAEDLVPGDLVLLEAGDIVPADLRILSANLLQSDESSLTGESLPIRKQTDAVAEDSDLAVRKSMLFRGARITEGTGTGLVTATGTDSELGRISELVSRAKRTSTPLEKQLDRLGYRLIRVVVILTLVIAAVGILMGRDVSLMIQTAIALAVAAIPEGLPVVATIALARGLWRMAERNALINRLSAVETLGSTGVICTDKTGTLTENRMKVSVLWMADEEREKEMKPNLSAEEGACRLLGAGCLCNNAQLAAEDSAAAGDPLEVSLLEGAQEAGLDLAEWIEEVERIGEVPFDSVSRRMATLCRKGGETVVSVKGAPEAIFPLCPDMAEEISTWEKRNASLASQGLRVIGLAGKSMEDSDEDPFANLDFYGLIGMMDPPRKDVPDAIEDCIEAGVRIVMVTGDQAETAKSIAEDIGLNVEEVMSGAELASLDPSQPEDRKRILRTNVISRATPTQKFELVQLYQEEGQVVAMTGDGVNDAPALKQADIGIAMGLRGTEVAREAAAMVLRDDAFPSIVAAIRQGRTIFSNIRKFVTYLISCNLSEIFVVGLAMLVASQLPILPLQILFLNLVTDVFPALALGVTHSQGNVLSHPPRGKHEPVLRWRDWARILRHALVIAAATLGAYVFAIVRLENTSEEAVTISFFTLAIAQLVHVFNMAERDEPYFASVIVRNPMVWAAHGVCIILLAMACYHPLLADVLSLREPSSVDWGVIFGFASVPLWLGLWLRRWD
ncbi:MAG: cation-transporting P-type ATPase [Verrucomicrobiales bacterium]|nr:cation-transporting P-type ATPase [Verrucomicrobiales bacterium]